VRDRGEFSLEADGGDFLKQMAELSEGGDGAYCCSEMEERFKFYAILDDGKSMS
jgi:hypothetical protein